MAINGSETAACIYTSHQLASNLIWLKMKKKIMNKIDEKFVIKKIKDHLSPKWSVVSEKDLHEKGCDIIVTDSRNKNEARRFFIECKGKSYAKSARAVNETQWLYALGQITTRMTVVARHAYKYGLGLPEVSTKTALRRIPW